MNNVFVYCELEGTVVAEVSLELLTKGRKLTNWAANWKPLLPVLTLQESKNKYCPSVSTVCTSSMLRACSLILHCPTLPYSSICLKKKSRKSA